METRLNTHQLLGWIVLGLTINFRVNHRQHKECSGIGDYKDEQEDCGPGKLQWHIQCIKKTAYTTPAETRQIPLRLFQVWISNKLILSVMTFFQTTTRRRGWPLFPCRLLTSLWICYRAEAASRVGLTFNYLLHTGRNKSTSSVVTTTILKCRPIPFWFRRKFENNHVMNAVVEKDIYIIYSVCEVNQHVPLWRVIPC